MYHNFKVLGNNVKVSLTIRDGFVPQKLETANTKTGILGFPVRCSQNREYQGH